MLDRDQFTTGSETLCQLVREKLNRIFEHKFENNPFFSSFSADVCICLALKQSTYPVYQLVNGDTGYWKERMDSRVRKVGKAATNVKFWNMSGVVSLVDEFLQNQGMKFQKKILKNL